MSAPTQSDLLALPAELRGQIWHLVLHDCSQYYLRGVPPHLSCPQHWNREHTPNNCLILQAATQKPALLQTCQQTRNEALSIFMAKTFFVLLKGIHFIPYRSTTLDIRELGGDQIATRALACPKWMKHTDSDLIRFRSIDFSYWDEASHIMNISTIRTDPGFNLTTRPLHITRQSDAGPMSRRE